MELDPVQACRFPRMPGVALEHGAVGGVQRHLKRSCAERGRVLSGFLRDDGRARIGQQGREDRKRIYEADHDLAVGRGRNALDGLCLSGRVVESASDRDEGGGHLFPRKPNRALEGCLDRRGG